MYNHRLSAYLPALVAILVVDDIRTAGGVPAPAQNQVG